MVAIQDISRRELGRSFRGEGIHINFMAKSQAAFPSPRCFLAHSDYSVLFDYSSPRVAKNLFASKVLKRVAPTKLANVVSSSPSLSSDSSIC